MSADHDGGQQEHAAGGGGLQELLEGRTTVRGTNRSENAQAGSRWVSPRGGSDGSGVPGLPTSSRMRPLPPTRLPGTPSLRPMLPQPSGLRPRPLLVEFRRGASACPSAVTEPTCRRCLARPPGTGTLVALWQKVSTLSHPPARPRSSSSAGSPRSPPSWRRSSCSPGAATVPSGSRWATTPRKRPSSPSRSRRVRSSPPPKAPTSRRRSPPPQPAAKAVTAALDTFYTEAFLDPANWQEGDYEEALAGLLGGRPSRGRAAARAPHRRHRGRAASRRSGPWHPP